jgi:hypothetical protein
MPYDSGFSSGESNSSELSQISSSSSDLTAPIQQSKRYSWVCRYFSQVNSKQAQCSICNEYIAINGTSGMKKHLELKHKGEIEQEKRVLPTVVKFIITAEVPFSVVNNEHFRTLSATDFDRHTISRHCVNMKKDLLEHISSVMEEKEEMSLIFDEWESDNGLSFFGVIANFINFQEEKIEELMLNCKYIRDSSASTIKGQIEEVINEFELQGKITAMTSDKGASLESALQNFDVKRFWCLNHIINLAINDMINKQPKIQKVFKKCSQIASHFSVSKKSRRLLKASNEEELFEIDESQSKTPQVFQEQRWISAHNVLYFIIKNIRNISDVLERRKKEESDFEFDIKFTNFEIELMYHLFVFLDEINFIVQKLESVNSTILDVYPLFYKMIRVLEKSIDTEDNFLTEDQTLVFFNEFTLYDKVIHNIVGQLQEKAGEKTERGVLPGGQEINQMINHFLIGINTRWNVEDETLIAATLLNPKNKNFEMLPGTSEEQKDHIYRKLDTELTKFIQASNIKTNQTPSPRPRKRRKGILFSEVQTNRAFNNEELNQYYKTYETYDDSVTFWMKNMNKFSYLSKYAFYLLSMKLSASCVERSWSMGSRIVSDQRHSLSYEAVESSVVLKFNQSLLKRIK